VTGTAPPAQVQSNFRKGTQPTIGVSGTYNATATMTAATQPLPTWFLPPNNILRGINLEIAAAASGNSATVAFQPDAPLNVFSTLNFATNGGQSIVGSFDSYTAGVIQKFGGYVQSADPKASAAYSVTTGSGSTGGSFTEVLRVPVEVVSRTGFGSLSNTNTEAPLQLSLTLNASSAIYSTAPTALPTVTVTGSLSGYWATPGAAQRATPRNFGSTQFWNSQTYNSLNGSQNYTLQAPPGMNNPHRNWVMLNRLASGGARNTSDFPSPITVNFRGNVLYQLDNLLWVDEMSRIYGYDVATLDAANGLNTGVFVIPFDADFTSAPGSEYGNGYLQTATGDPILLTGGFGAACNLTWLVNFINVVGGQAVGTA
jgi:hypothetical protein